MQRGCSHKGLHTLHWRQALKLRGSWRPVQVRSGKTDPVQFKGVFKQGPFAYKNGRFASSFLLLGIGLFIGLEKSKFVFQESLSETPFTPDQVSFCTLKQVLIVIITNSESGKGSGKFMASAPVNVFFLFKRPPVRLLPPLQTEVLGHPRAHPKGHFIHYLHSCRRTRTEATTLKLC